MVTLTTKKLQSQRLDDLAHESYDAGPASCPPQYSAQKLTKSSHPFPFETNKEEHPWEVVGGGRPVGSQVAVGPASPSPPGHRGPSEGALSAWDRRGSAGPPTERHGHSLSEPEELARGGSPRCPGGPRVWTPVTKRRCHSSGSAWLPGRVLPATSAASPPAPWPASGLGRPPDGDRTPSPRRRLSPPQECLELAVAAPSSAAARLHPRQCPRPSLAAVRACSAAARSSACTGEKGPRKRGRADDTRWPRPALDFLKMARILKTSKSFCPLYYEDEDEEDARVRTALSSPRDLRGPAMRSPGLCPTSPGLGSWWAWATGAGEGGSGGDTGDWDSAGEEGVMPPGPGELDPEQMESR